MCQMPKTLDRQAKIVQERGVFPGFAEAAISDGKLVFMILDWRNAPLPCGAKVVHVAARSLRCVYMCTSH